MGERRGKSGKGHRRHTLRLHARRLAVATVNSVINRRTMYAAVGRVNRRYGAIASVFLVYPAREEYALAYVTPRRIELIRWRPWPVGIIRQNGRFSIMFGVSSTEDHFRSNAHHRDLASLLARVDELRSTLGASQRTFAGVLPGVLVQRGLLTDSPEADITAKVVVAAIRALKQDLGLPVDAPVMVLGGAGHVGRRIVRQLPADSRAIIIDRAHGHPFEIPSDLRGKPTVLLNVAAPDAITEHLDDMWPEMVVLNEVYPEPNVAQLQTLAANGVSCYHVAGVKARAFPPFPAAYAGAIPCCAAWPSDDLTPVLRHLPPTPRTPRRTPA